MGSFSLSFALLILAGLVWNSYGGVDVEIIRPGDGKTFPQKGQTVVIHYTGYLTNGKKFDSSRERGRPFEFEIGEGKVLKGMDKGVAQMSVGEMARLTMSPDYGYGTSGYPPGYRFIYFLLEQILLFPAFSKKKIGDIECIINILTRTSSTTEGLILAFTSFCKGQEPTCSGKRCEELLAKIEKLECRLEYSREMLEDQTKMKKKENPVPEQGCAKCPEKWMQFNGSCYLFVATKRPFGEANAHCLGLGAHLVHIGNGLENEFLRDQLRTLIEIDYWIGLSDVDTEGVYRWVDDNSTVSFTDWYTLQPDNKGGKEHCVHFRSTYNYNWNDDICSVPHCSICEQKVNA